VTLKSSVPVITLKGDFTRMGEKILVPLDLTKETSRQLSSALLYGLNYGAEIHLVSALIRGIEIIESRIYRKLSQAKNMLEENGVKCRFKIFERSDVAPFKRVLEYAGDIDAGMILLMTHEEGYTYDNYIGAFAHQIINQSKVPVLSLTSRATNFDDRNLLKGIVDPVGILINE
jgi:nucleotide-binding universal stress UspA family protein